MPKIDEKLVDALAQAMTWKMIAGEAARAHLGPKATDYDVATYLATMAMRVGAKLPTREMVDPASGEVAKGGEHGGS